MIRRRGPSVAAYHWCAGLIFHPISASLEALAPPLFTRLPRTVSLGARDSPNPQTNIAPMPAEHHELPPPVDTGLDDDDDLALLPQQNTSSSLVQDRAKGRLTPGRILTFINGICHSNLGIVPQQLPCIRVHRLTMRCEHLQSLPRHCQRRLGPLPFPRIIVIPCPADRIFSVSPSGIGKDSVSFGNSEAYVQNLQTESGSNTAPTQSRTVRSPSRSTSM